MLVFTYPLLPWSLSICVFELCMWPPPPMDWSRFFLLSRRQERVYGYFWVIWFTLFLAWLTCLGISYLFCGQDVAGLIGEDATIQWLFGILTMAEFGLGVFIAHLCHGILTARVVEHQTYKI
jgi:hypothetical protein